MKQKIERAIDILPEEVLCDICILINLDIGPSLLYARLRTILESASLDLSPLGLSAAHMAADMAVKARIEHERFRVILN